MRNNKMKGFTLVELLVVIAILAILATVSVVGYTSYIESTNITVDENLAAQLNRFLEAYKVNFTGDIDENNIREVTLEILKEGGLEGQLIAKSKDRDFYFDLKDGKYVLRTDEESGILTPGYKVFFGLDTLAADGSEYEVKIENCFTPDHRYFYVGSTSEDAPISLIIDAFYKFNPDPENHKDLVSKINNLGISDLTTFVENAVVVTDECNYRLGDNQTNVIFADGVNMIGTVTKAWNGTDWTPVTGEYVLATLAGKLTIPGSVKFFAEDALNLGADGTIVINKTARDVAYMSNANFANDKVTLKLTDGEFYTLDSVTGENEGKPVVTNGTVEYLIQYSNPMVSFDIYVSDANNIRNIYTENGELTNSANIAWELNSFDLLLEAVGEDSTIPATHKEVTWSVVSGTGVTFSGNKATFASTMANVSDTIVIKATSTNDTSVTQEFTINVGKATAASVNLVGKSLNTLSTIYLVHGGNTNVHTVELKGVTYNDVGANLTLDTTLDVTYEGTGLTEENNVLTTSGNGEGKLTVKVGKYLTYTVDVVVFDKSSLPVGTVENITVLAQGSATAPIKISDLFTAKNASKIPADAEVRFTYIDADDKYVEFDRSFVEFVKDSAGNAITSLAWSNTTGFYFNETSGEDTIAISVFSADGTRISDDIIVKVVSGDNARVWADINKTINANMVLLSDITFPTDAQLSITGGTFYGNKFTLDVRNAKKDAAEHIISLSNATLDGLNIVGKVYSTFTYQDHYASGKVDSTSIVVSNNGTIKNCYIANGRAPIRVIGDTRVEDSIIFGGKYCNIDVKKGVLTLAGDVTTINQVYEDAVGAGIVCDLTTYTNYVTLATGCDLVQYNFIPKSAGSALPTVSITMELMSYKATISVRMGTMISSLIDDPEGDYDDWVFATKDENNNVTKEYLNAGIVYLVADGGHMDYDPDGDWKNHLAYGATHATYAGIVSAISSDNRTNGSVPSGYAMATYTETYHPGDEDILRFYVNANAYVYSPVSTNSTYVNTWFANANNEEYMKQYLPTNYVEGEMK